MRRFLTAFFGSMLVVTCRFPQDCFAEQNAGPSFRLRRDTNQHVVAADYYTAAGVERALLRGTAQQKDFASFAQLRQLPRLASLMFPYGTELTAEELDQLSRLTHLVEIELGFVGVSSEYVTIQGDLLKLGKLKRLERVHLCKQNMTDDDLKFIAVLPNLTHLEFSADTNGRRLKGPTATDRCADYLVRARNLRSIWIHDGEKLTDRFVAKLTAGLPDLEYLDLISPELTDASLCLLADRCKQLNWLNLGSHQFTDDGVKQLGRLPHMERLWIESGPLSGVCVPSLAGLGELKHLGLSLTSIDDDGLRMLAKLRQLEILSVRQLVLTDKQLQVFRRHPTLESLFVNGRDLSQAAVVQWIETMPKLQHLTVGSNKKLQIAVDRALASRHEE